MRLHTARLVVRDLTLDDLDAVHRIVDLDLAMDPRDRQGRQEWLHWTVLDYRQRALLHQPPYGEYGVERTDSGELIGLTGLVPSMMPFGLLPYYRDLCPAYRHGWNVPEVGMFWAVATAHQRRGFAAEAAGAVLAYCFQELRLRRVVATTEHTNTASIGVMRRLGMRVEHNPGPDPFYLQVVGIADNPAAATGPT